MYDFYTHRITPAWAGKSYGLTAKAKQKQDHPRVGGEKRKEKQAGNKWEGSPPRGRGKGVNIAVPDTLIGITPA